MRKELVLDDQHNVHVVVEFLISKSDVYIVVKGQTISLMARVQSALIHVSML